MATGVQRRTRWERVAALELPPTRWEQAWASLQRRDVLLRIGLCVATAVMVCVVIRGWHPPFVFRVGQVLPGDVVARAPFQTEDQEATRSARDLARRQVRWIYVHDPRPLDRTLEALTIAVGEVGIIRRIHELAEENAELLSYLEKKNILPGTKVSVTEILPFNQTITIEVDGQPVTLGNAAARYIFVEKA